ncbi:MAG: DUF4179 domain-containing protein [Lachnospiraceae bacterium]|jgi:hypothetical protein|nr:DUF4179 domain-containing protein [Lachnospiraceae bacterium]
MSTKKNVFSEEVELSEIVLEKTNQAFEMIQQEDIVHMGKTNTKGKRIYKMQAAAVAGICILVVSSISVIAAIHHYWGRGMNGNIQASDAQQQALTEQNIAKVYREEPDSSSMAVTDNGITVKPDTVVVDERFAYMSFSISGYHVEDGTEPGFGMVTVYQGDNPEDESAWVNMYGSMYDGIIPDENGSPVYEDGSPLESDENGRLISHYTDSNGDMEYIIQASVVNENDSLLGKTMHVNFQNLGTHSRGAFTPAVEGNWDFAITLPDVSSSRTITVGQKVGGTGFTLETIDISPISMKANYSVEEAPEGHEDDLGIPEVRGVVLKDGTRLPYLTDGGSMGYTDSSRKNACHMAGYDRVIDVDEVAALIVWTSYENEKVEIPISK